MNKHPHFPADLQDGARTATRRDPRTSGAPANRRPGSRPTIVVLLVTMLLPAAGLAVDRYPPQPRINELYPSPARHYLRLEGEWMATLTKLADPGAAADDAFDLRMQVPGCLEGQGMGLDIPPVTIDKAPVGLGVAGFRTQPGDPTFRRRFTIPADWAGKRILLGLGGTTGICEAWLDGRFVPELFHPISATGVQADLTEHLKPGDHVLTIRTRCAKVDLGHFITRLFWKYRGIIRGVEAVAVEPLHLSDLRIVGDPDAKAFTVTAFLSQPAPADCRVRLRVYPTAASTVLGTAEAVVPAGTRRLTLTVPVPELGLWSHRSPELAVLTATLERSGKTLDVLRERSGLRRVSVTAGKGRRGATVTRHVLVNGVPVFLAGEMTHCHWPGTFSPCTDRDELRKHFRRFKQAGFNFMRLHTHVAHPEMLDVCDELGIYVQSETMSIRAGHKRPKPPVTTPGATEQRWPPSVQIWREVLQRDRNHPSLLVLCFDNERSPFVKSKSKKGKHGRELKPHLKECQRLAFELDGNRLYLTESGRGGTYLMSDATSLGPIWKVEHESGKWGSYPDPGFRERHPDLRESWHIAWVEPRLEQAGLLDLWPVFARNSQYLQARCVALGYQLKRGRYDYIGMEHSTVRDSYGYHWGVLDDYFEPKTPPPFQAEIRNSLADTAILPLGPTSGLAGQDLRMHARISHYGAAPLAGCRLEITAGETPALTWTDIAQACGSVKTMDKQAWTAPMVRQPQRVGVSARLLSGTTTIAEQRWRIWVFPKPEKAAATVTVHCRGKENNGTIQTLKGLTAPDAATTLIITDDLERARDEVTAGGRVLLLNSTDKKLRLSGSLSGWTACRADAGHHATIINAHPLLAEFPHDGWAEECFRHAINRGNNDLFRYGWSIGKKWVGVGWSVRSDILPGLEPAISTIPRMSDPKPWFGTWLATLSHESGGRMVVTTLMLDDKDPLGHWLAGRILDWLTRDGGGKKAGSS